MMSSTKLIAITGAAAVGKSTLSRALQAEFGCRGELWLVMELDTFARGLSREWISAGNRHGRYAERGFTYARAEDGSIDLSIGIDGRTVLAAFHRSVAAIARSGPGVICETIVYDDADWRDWSAALGDIAACWVKLSAPLAILEARETANRTRVLQGLARGMSARRPVGKYSVEADTDAEPAEAIARRIVASIWR